MLGPRAYPAVPSDGQSRQSIGFELARFLNENYSSRTLPKSVKNENHVKHPIMDKNCSNLGLKLRPDKKPGSRTPVWNARNKGAEPRTMKKVRICRTPNHNAQKKKKSFTPKHNARWKHKLHGLGPLGL